MTSSHLNSMHLDGQPRRELFRQARDRLHACCGTHTVAGNLRTLDDEQRVAERREFPSPMLGAVYQLKDGDRFHSLKVGVNSVGRLADNAIVISDDHISRRHCAVILHSDGRMELHDIASKNGTLLNGKKISGPTPIAPGDQITLCGKMFEVVVR